MSRSFSFGKIELTGRLTSEAATAKPLPSTPMQIGVLGDFSGRLNRPAHGGPPKLKPKFIDRDTFDDVLSRLDVRLEGILTDTELEPLSIHFKQLDDFHPDALFERVELFASLRQLRRRLGNPATYNDAAREVKAWAEPVEAASRTDDQDHPPSDQPSPYSIEGLFDETLGATQARADRQRPQSVALDYQAMIREIAAPYAVPGVPAEQADLTACVDDAISQLMRGLLHHPYFQSIESAWRSLFFLVRRLPTDVNLKLFLIDISKRDLARDLAEDDLSGSATYEAIVQQTVGTAGSTPWGLLIGNYSFDDTPEDAQLLGRMATIASAAGAPLIAAASDRLCGADSLAVAPDLNDWRTADQSPNAVLWQALGELPQSTSLALAAPGWMMRLPYGSRTDAIESFQFEETASPPRHGDYLWGNPAFACGFAIARAFIRDGWDLDPDTFLEIDDLPLHVYEDEGEPACHPCGECLLSDRAVEHLQSRRLIPLMSYRDTDRIRLAGFRSLAGPGHPLTGRWSSEGAFEK